jgi:protein phosphatase
MVMEGEISEEEAETHPHRSILTRALGVDQNIQVDEGDLEVAPGDRLLLCTDGLTGMVPEAEIREILLESLDPQEAVDKLVKVANRAGGIDNITALILDFANDGGGPGATKGSATPGQPPSERPIAPAAPTNRSDITIVGAPIPEPRPGSSVAPTSRPASRTDRPATEGRPERSRPGSRRAVGRKVGIWTGVALAIVTLGVVGLRLYLDTQWYVGVSNGRVAIFRGVPAEVAGLELSSVVVETSIPAERAESIGFYRGLPDGITADDRAGAEAIVESIREDVARFEQPSP